MSQDCEFCGNPAQWQFTEVVGGQKHTVDVCLSCAHDRGMAGPSSSTSPGAPSSSGFSVSIEVEATVDAGSVPTAPRRCELCQTPLVEIRKSGRVGCAGCYVAFREHLKPLLLRVHGCLQHRGQGPGQAAAAEIERQELSRLDDELGRAVADENFEAAARLRDRISRQKRASAEGGE